MTKTHLWMPRRSKRLKKDSEQASWGRFHGNKEASNFAVHLTTGETASTLAYRLLCEGTAFSRIYMHIVTSTHVCRHHSIHLHSWIYTTHSGEVVHESDKDEASRTFCHSFLATFCNPTACKAGLLVYRTYQTGEREPEAPQEHRAQMRGG
jgi:hypothetical protein